MQLPPPDILALEPLLPKEMAGPPDYKWDPDFPGTIKPGQCEDNFPLEDVLNSGVYERMKYDERDIDECAPVIHEPDEDLLQWLAKEGRLLPRDVDIANNDEVLAMKGGVATVAEEDLADFNNNTGEEDDKSMLAYYSRQKDSPAPPAE